MFSGIKYFLDTPALIIVLALVSAQSPGQQTAKIEQLPPDYGRADAMAVSGPIGRLYNSVSQDKGYSAVGPVGFDGVLSGNGLTSAATAKELAVQTTPFSALPMPTPLLSFDGLSNEDNALAFSLLFAPADMIGDVGPDHYVQVVNSLIRVYDKSGLPLTPPTKLSSLFTPLGTTCATRNDGLPNVLYDQFADRWVISQVCSAFPPFRQMIAVSATGDPTGAYFAYEFVMPNVRINDFPKIGMWSNGYYMATDEFLGSTFVGNGVFAFDRDKMLAGDRAAGFIYFSIPTDAPIRRRGFLPADADGLRAPPPDTPALFITFTADEYGDAADTLRIFEFDADFSEPANSSFTESAGSPVSVASFDPTSPNGRADIAQPPPGEFLDSQSDRLNHRLAYRNFGTHESITVNQTVRTSLGLPYRAGVRVYELRRNGGAFFPSTQATLGDNASSRWVASAAQDNAGNLAAQYNFVSDDKKVSIFYSGRLADDPPSAFRTEGTLVEGTGVQRAFGWRWGEYSGMTVDPVDDCTFWFTNGYYTLESEEFSVLGWLTRIGAFSFDECEPAAAGEITGRITDAATGEALSNARVSTGPHLRYTNGAGAYSRIRILPGSHVVTASAKGYRTQTAPVGVDNGETVVRDFSLEPVPVLVPLDTGIAAESCTLDGAADPGERITLNVTLFNDGARAATDLTAEILPGGGIVDPGPPQSYGPLPAGSSATRGFEFTIASDIKCGTRANLSLQMRDGVEELGDVTIEIQTGNQVIAFAEDFDSVAAPQLPDGWTTTSTENHQLWRTSGARVNSPPNAVFSPAPHQRGVNELVSPKFAVNTGDARLTFRNWYELETTFLRNRLFDGSVLEIKIGAGDWQDILDAGGSFESGGYDGTIDSCCQNPLAGRLGWSGRSGVNQQSEFIDTVAKLPALAAANDVRLRWRIGTDIGTFREGQYIDDLVVADGYSCSCGLTVPNRAPFDFDGDGTTDLAVHNIGGQLSDFRIITSSDGSLRQTDFGSAGDIPANADFDGDGKTDIAIFRPSTGEWWILNSRDLAVTVVRFGLAGDLIRPDDLDGDGRSDIVLYRPGIGTWYVFRSSDESVETVLFGLAEDTPLTADFDGDRRADIAVYRPSAGVWYIRRSSDSGVSILPFGLAGDRPVTGDFDGDGRDDITLYRAAEGIWYLLQSKSGFAAYRFGTVDDIPLRVDFDGDGRADIAVFRPSTNVWYHIRSSDGEIGIRQFGETGDLPVPGIFAGPQ